MRPSEADFLSPYCGSLFPSYVNASGIAFIRKASSPQETIG
jgi:hypothetical protein